MGCKRDIDEVVRRVLTRAGETRGTATDLKVLERYLGRVYVAQISDCGVCREDFTSECILRILIWRESNRADPEAPSAMLHRVARNLRSDIIRRRNVQRKHARAVAGGHFDAVIDFEDDVPEAQRWVHGFPTPSEEPGMTSEFRSWLSEVDRDLVTLLDLKLEARRLKSNKRFEKQYVMQRENITGKVYAEKSQLIEERRYEYLSELDQSSGSDDDQ